MMEIHEWHVFWVAGSVIFSLGTLIFGCFRSLSSELKDIDKRLSKMEGAQEERAKWNLSHFNPKDII